MGMLGLFRYIGVKKWINLWKISKLKNYLSGHGSSGSIMDSLKMPVMTPEQELKHQQQARKGIQTSPDGNDPFSFGTVYEIQVTLKVIKYF